MQILIIKKSKENKVKVFIDIFLAILLFKILHKIV